MAKTNKGGPGTSSGPKTQAEAVLKKVEKKECSKARKKKAPTQNKAIKQRWRHPVQRPGNNAPEAKGETEENGSVH